MNSDDFVQNVGERKGSKVVRKFFTTHRTPLQKTGGMRGSERLDGDTGRCLGCGIAKKRRSLDFPSTKRLGLRGASAGWGEKTNILN